jgi:Zn-dependent protease with chaperone function
VSKDERDDIRSIFAQMRGEDAEGAEPGAEAEAPAPKAKAGKKKAKGGKKKKPKGKPSPRAIPNLVRLPNISPRAWEHPADRAALTTLRKIPGFDQLLRRVFGMVSDRSLRLLYLANTVKVGPTQFKRVHEALQDCVAVLDAPYVPDLFIAQTPIVNAGAVGIDEPFIVLNSGTVDLLDDDELRFIIGHELGHALSGHALYKTMVSIILNLSVFRIGVVGMVGMAIYMAMREWSRKAELSADRAGMLCVQDPTRAYRVHMKMAGGDHLDQMDLDAFIAQADAYQKDGDFADAALKIMHLLGRTHPFAVLRLSASKGWVDDGGYAKVLDGDYPRRDDDGNEGVVYEAVSEGVDHYTSAGGDDTISRVVGDLGQGLTEVSSALWDQVSGLFKRKDDKGDTPDRDDQGE